MKRMKIIIFIFALIFIFFLLKKTIFAADMIYKHNFTTDGLNDDFFDITGSLSSSSDEVVFENLSLKTCLKMETKTRISFEINEAAQLTLIFDNGSTAKIKIDGTNYQVQNGKLTVSLDKGSHVISKADICNIYYIKLNISNNETSSSTVSEESSTLNETVTDTTTVDDDTVIVPQITSGDVLIFWGLMILAGLLISMCVLWRI